jgi:hypothetical protein
MPSEIYNNIQLNKPAPLDARLIPVNTKVDLPSATSPFLYEGAKIYVLTEKAEYRLEKNSSNVLVWVKQLDEGLTQGIINIVSTAAQIDLVNTTPAIATCDSVVIKISGSATTATIYKILNMPANKDIKFYVETGKSVVFKHADWTSASDGAIVLEDGKDMEIFGRTIGNEMLWLEKNGTALVQRGATQFVSSNEWSQVIIEIGIDDNLTSFSTNRALSANQGRVLNDAKQDKFTVSPAERLNFNATTKVLSFLPYETEAISLAWSYAQIAAASANVTTFLTSLKTAYNVTEITQKNRYIDMTPTASSGTKALNFGSWLIPAGMSLSVANNWVRLSPPVGILQVQFPLVPRTLGGAATTGLRSVSFYTNGLGSLKNFLTFDTINGSNQATSFKFTYTEAIDSIYEIEYDIILLNSTAEQRNIFAILYKDNYGSLISALDIAPVGNQEATTDTPYNGWAPQGGVGNRFRINLKKKVQSNAGNNTSFTLLLNALATVNFTNVDIVSGTLTITKIA